MPITEALKKLIKTITGKNAVGETIEELVTNLNDNYPEGGGGVTYETLAEVSGGSTGSGVKMIHATVVLPETEGGDITLDIDETDEECRAMVTSGEPVVIEVMAPVAELGTSLPIYGLMTSFYAPTENLWSATFCIIVDYNRTSIQAFVATLGSSDDGKRGMVIERNYDFSPKVVKVDFSVDYENKVLLSASHTPAEVVALVEGGTWVYGYDTTKGLYELTHINKTKNPTGVTFNGTFGDDSSIETDENGDWIYRYK